MTTKKTSYMKLLTEAIRENMGHEPVAKDLDVKGPMLDPILKYNGDGELQTKKDAASILERHYFGETSDSGVSTLGENENTNEIPEVPEKDIAKTKKDIEDEVTEGKEEDKKDDEKEEKEDKEEKEELSDEEMLENTIIEKLIEEMEDEGEPDEIENQDGDEEVAESKDMKKEADNMEDEELDVDEELEGDEIEENAPVPSMDVDKEDHGQEDELEEMFNIFKESIEEDSDELEINDDNIRV